MRLIKYSPSSAYTKGADDASGCCNGYPSYRGDGGCVGAAMNGWLIEGCEEGYRATRPGATLTAPTREEVERKARGYDAQQWHDGMRAG